jgi:hypothetical protein
VSALNAGDSQALRRLSANHEDPALDQAVARRSEEQGGRNLHLTSQDIQSPVPDQAAAHLTGTMTDDSGRERLFLDRADGRWYIKLLPSPPPPTGGVLPTAGTVPAP